MASVASNLFCPFTNAQCREDCALMDKMTEITMDGASQDFSCAIMQMSLHIASLVEALPEDGSVE